MNTVIENNLIEFDRMKTQVESSVVTFAESLSMRQNIPIPRISFEKGATHVMFPLPELNEGILSVFVTIIKDHLDHVRIHSYGDGYYAFQALHKSLFKTENILDNFKIEFFGLTTNFKAEMTKKGNLSQEEVNCVLEIFQAAYRSMKVDPVQRLKQYGATVYIEKGTLDWSYIAGYEEVKRKIRESIIMPLQNPEVYDSIAKMTRKVHESNRPSAILFDGMPGVGKTTVARIIAGEVMIPLVYVPIESIMSKWYGQSSQNLAEIFDACEDLEGCILFLDEIDSLAGSRDQNMFEATRRILSVLLRKLDGIDSITNTIAIGATNRKKDLDHALISRFDQCIHFPLPNEQERASIFANYAQHLSPEELKAIAAAGEGLSGRNIKDICEQAERRWARKLLIKKMEASAPPYEYYRHTAKSWKEEQNRL